jgi:hypothetical protein
MELFKKKQGMYLQKIRRRKDEIRGYMISNQTPITDIVYRETPAYEKYADAVQAKDYKPIRRGDRWGGGINGWFKMRFVIPGAWKARRLRHT